MSAIYSDIHFDDVRTSPVSSHNFSELFFGERWWFDRSFFRTFLLYVMRMNWNNYYPFFHCIRIRVKEIHSTSFQKVVPRWNLEFYFLILERLSKIFREISNLMIWSNANWHVSVVRFVHHMITTIAQFEEYFIRFNRFSLYQINVKCCAMKKKTGFTASIFNIQMWFKVRCATEWEYLYCSNATE